MFRVAAGNVLFFGQYACDCAHARSDFRSARRCLSREHTEAFYVLSFELSGDATSVAKKKQFKPSVRATAVVW